MNFLKPRAAPPNQGLLSAAQASNNAPHFVPPGNPEPAPAVGHNQYHINNNPMWGLLKMDPNQAFDQGQPVSESNSPWQPNPLGPTNFANNIDPTNIPGGPGGPVGNAPGSDARAGDWYRNNFADLYYSSFHPGGGGKSDDYVRIFQDAKTDDLSQAGAHGARAGMWLDGDGGKRTINVAGYAGEPVYNTHKEVMGFFDPGSSPQSQTVWSRKSVIDQDAALGKGLISQAMLDDLKKAGLKFA